MFHDESWKSVYFGVKRHKTSLAWIFALTLVSAGFFWFADVFSVADNVIGVDFLWVQFLIFETIYVFFHIFHIRHS